MSSVRFRENRLTSLCFFVRRPGGRVTFFACTKKVTKEMHPRLRAGLRPVRCGRPGFGGRAPALSPKAGRPGPPRVRGTRPDPADLRRFTEGPRIKSEERRSQSFCGRDCRALLFPGPLQVAASRWRKSRAAIAGRMPASSASAQGCAVAEPRSLLAECAGRDARAPRPRGCPFFGYFLWASKESDSAARTADEKTQGRETVFARRTTSKDKIKMDSGLRRNDGRLSPE